MKLISSKYLLEESSTPIKSFRTSLENKDMSRAWCDSADSEAATDRYKYSHREPLARLCKKVRKREAYRNLLLQ